MTYYSFAKINLALDIIGKDPSGFHKVQTVLQEISAFDEIMVDKIEDGGGEFEIKFRGEEAKLIDPNDNTVMKAVKLLNEAMSFKHSYKIVIYKNIPLGAGLGGGSSNAATILKILNEHEELGLTNDDLRKLGARIGTDVPFFIEGGTAFGSGFGEKIKLLPLLKDFHEWQEMQKVLVVPNLRKSTENMYKKVSLDKTGRNADSTVALVNAIEKENFKKIIENIHNDFELFTDSGFTEIKATLEKNKAEKVLLCGSGSAIFALSNNQFDLKALSQALPNQHILDLNQ